MLRNVTIQVKPGRQKLLYSYLDHLTVASTNLYNSALFVTRQVLFGLNPQNADKTPDPATVEVLQSIRDAIPEMQKLGKKAEQSDEDGKKEKVRYEMPTEKKTFLGYQFLDAYFKVTQNPAYCAEGFPRQSAQQVLKVEVRDMKGFYAALRQYKKNPELFLGRPKLPGYKPKGRGSTATLTNQNCHLVYEEDGECMLTFPQWKVPEEASLQDQTQGVSQAKVFRPTLSLGKYIPKEWRLIHVTVTPYQGEFSVHVIVDDGCSEPKAVTREESRRICAMDLGICNFAAMTNNIGEPPVLFKGGAVQQTIYTYSKKMAKIQSKETEGTTKRFVPTPRARKLMLWRDHWMDDYMHKTAKKVVEWCTDHQIDTLVVGANPLWKQEADLGKKTQSFEQIPYDRFRSILDYLCKRHGILYIEREESYTSKASFLSEDFIPTYTPKKEKDESGEASAEISDQEEQKYAFSGTRKGRLYHDNRLDITVNADIQGSANIGRKEFPTLFVAKSCDIQNPPVIYRHPDLKPVAQRIICK